MQDIYADDADGGVLLTREATNGGIDNFGNGQLCGGTSSPCRTMWMVRFDAAADVEWETIVRDPRPDHFVMVCITDNTCRVARPNPYRTVAEGECDGTLFGGELVLAATEGYWTAWSQGGQIRLDRFSTGASDTTVLNAVASEHPHLVRLSDDKMLLTWEAGDGMAAQIRSAVDGSPVGSQFTIDVTDHSYHAFKAYPDDSATYPGAGSSNTAIRIARVRSCD